MEYKEFKKKSSDETSVWHHYLRAEDGMSAKCKHCKRIIKTSGGTTTSLHTHLRASHLIVLARQSSSSSISNQIPIPSTYHPVPSIYQPIPSTSDEPRESQSNSTAHADSEPVLKKSKLSDFFPRINSCETRVARMTALDGIPFRTFVKSQDMRELFKKDGHNLPKSATTISSMVSKYSDKVKNEVTKELEKLKKEMNVRFSASFDEWTSSRNRRYLNVNIHSENLKKGFINLGLCRLIGSMPAYRIAEKLRENLKTFNLSLEEDIVCIVTDGASVMCKLGKDIDVLHQLCFAHGVQLGVIDVLYKKNDSVNIIQSETIDEEILSDDDDENDTEGFNLVQPRIEREMNSKYKDLINKVRKTVKYFRSSPLRNEILQKYVRQEFGKELVLEMDCRTRWSTLSEMLGRVAKLRNCIHKALFDAKSNIQIDESEFDLIHSLHESLEVVKITVESICRRDANLITCDAAINFMLNKLKAQGNILSSQIYQALKTRIDQRLTINTYMVLYLHNPTAYFERDNDYPDNDHLLGGIERLYSRLHSTTQTQPQLERSELASSSPTLSLEMVDSRLELECVIANVMAKKPSKTGEESLHDVIRIEMTLFESNGERGPCLEKVYNNLLTIPPTSVEAERAFSAAGYLTRNLRSGMGDNSLDALCFLRSHFQLNKDY